MAAVTLPDDAVRDILVRVADPATLFRCATTCKRWRALVADPSLLRRRWPEDAPESSSLLGFFAPGRFGREPGFVPAPRSPISCCNTSFLSNTDGSLDGAEPLASRHGLLLVRLHHRVSADGAIHLAVCNPLANARELLPPLRLRAFSYPAGYAILTSADYCSSRGPLPPGCSPFFKVLVISTKLDARSADWATGEYSLHMLSSDESSGWTAPRRCFSRRGITDVDKKCRATVCRGMAYWLFRGTSSYYILEVSADTGHVSFAKLPIQLYFSDIPPCLSVAIDGSLSFFCRRDWDQVVEKWTRQEGDDRSSEWICTRIINVEQLKMYERALSSIYVCEKSNKLFFFVNSRLHVADLQTGTTQDITPQFRTIIVSLWVPFEVDWAAFFSSRLGGHQSFSHARNTCFVGQMPISV